MTETEAFIALNMISGIGPVRLRKLLAIFETPECVLSAKASALRNVQGIGRDTADLIIHWEKTVDLNAELARIREFGANVVTQSSPEYPAALREIHDPPIVLYVWGSLTANAANDRTAIGIVGSRRTSHYGLECAKKLSYQLAYAGLTVISGLARGIDTAAHQGALAAKGRTIAIIGAGLNKLYPPENQALAEKIAETGAVISEYPMDRPADRQTFPYRNRIVSGWSAGTLVIEAGFNSGAIITANQAIEQGRNVYAVPGQIDRPTSAGSNRLIQQGAKLVVSASDILDDLEMLLPEMPEKPSPRLQSLTPEEQTVYDAISENETPIDTIIEKSGLQAGNVSSTLLALEMRRFVKQLPGQHFVKLL